MGFGDELQHVVKCRVHVWSIVKGSYEVYAGPVSVSLEFTSIALGGPSLLAFVILGGPLCLGGAGV